MKCSDLAKEGYKFRVHVKRRVDNVDTHIHVWGDHANPRIPVDGLPVDDQELKKRFEEEWEAKDAMLGATREAEHGQSASAEPLKSRL